ncbi:replication initiator protein A [Ruegeria sp. HKCCA5929]|uniref:replication initiator protein A n=1 Tax=Ruegeria sp. HKCCA5929 TaxID=2682988 RepID=UPI0014881342|nr:replication initiator protein A [Ruegeria sp. HKCCA5929]
MKSKNSVSDTPNHKGSDLFSKDSVSKTPNRDENPSISKDSVFDTPNRIDGEIKKSPNLALPDTTGLLPERHPQSDLFLCDIADAVFKDIHQGMEHPFFSLSKKPDTTPREYEHNEKWIKINPSPIGGMPTIYDKDVLIYAISQLIAALNRGERVSRRIRINSRDFLVFSNRKTGGKDYKAMEDSLERLSGTRIRTNIVTGDEEQLDGFGLINAYSVRKKRDSNGKEGKMLWVEIELSSWVFNAIEQREVLTLSPDYFRLRKPLERRIYELARKHCGRKSEWKCSVDILYNKSGSRSNKRQFRYLLSQIAQTNHLPDYFVESDGQEVTFRNRGTVGSSPAIEILDAPTLPSYAYEDAREAAPGWDPYYLEQEWKTWVAKECIDVKSPGKHFRKFCESFYEKNGRPQ